MVKKYLVNDKKQLKLWLDHLEWDRILTTTREFTPEILKELQVRIDSWRYDFVDLLATRRKPPMKKGSEQVGVVEEYQPGSKFLQSGYSAFYMKFETIRHWPKLISFNGPVNGQDGTPYEYHHLTNKGYLPLLNLKDYEKDALDTDCSRRAFKNSELYSPLDKVQPHTDYEPYGKKKDQKIPQNVETLLFESSSLEDKPKLTIFSKFFYRSKMISPEHDLCLLLPRNYTSIDRIFVLGEGIIVVSFSYLICSDGESFIVGTIYKPGGVDADIACRKKREKGKETEMEMEKEKEKEKEKKKRKKRGTKTKG